MRGLLLAALAALVQGAAAPPRERPPAVAGRFYPADPMALGAAVDILLSKAKSPALPGELVALVVPHAGIEFSGAAAAKAYAALKPGRWDSVIVIGSGHYKLVEGAALYPGPYATPIGRAEYDGELAAALKEAEPAIVESEEAHRNEHSIEVNIPFLLKRLGPFKMVGLVMNTQELEPAVKVGEAVAKAAKGRRVLIIASSDLSHYPSGSEADRVDKTTLLALGTLDPAFFWVTNRLLMGRGIRELACTWCGEGAVTAVLAAARRLGATRATLLDRYNSGDVVSERDYSHVVGYAALALTSAKGPAPSPYKVGPKDKARLLKEARDSIRRQLDGLEPAPPELSEVPAFNLPAAVFVTLQIPRPGDPKGLRGCIGSVVPDGSLLESVRRHAVDAAFRDPRFQPLSLEELSKVRIEVSILSPRRPVSAQEVRPGKDGVVLEKDGHSGVFLPQVWESLPGKEEFFGELCSQKAGLPRDCYKDPKTRLLAFTAEAFEE